MKFIEPKVELWEQGYDTDSIYNHIARCARVCYQTEPKNEPSLSFLKRTIFSNNHLSVLEHGTVYLITMEHHVADFFEKNPYSKVVVSKVGYCITTNVRVLHENDLMYLLSDARKPTEYHHLRVTFSITTNIGISRELNRHRTHSISEESTRYCNYNKGRFGSELTFILDDYYNFPEVIDESVYYNGENLVTEDGEIAYKLDDETRPYFQHLQNTENLYLNLINSGDTPQHARSVLPLTTKTQLVHTAFVEDWNHFLDLRFNESTGKVHPDMKIIAGDINDELTNRLLF